MGLMMSRRRTQAAKEFSAAKHEAHAKNHKAAHEAHAKKHGEAVPVADKVKEDVPVKPRAK